MPPNKLTPLPAKPARVASINGILIGVLAVAVLGTAWLTFRWETPPRWKAPPATEQQKPIDDAPREHTQTFPITVRKPAGPPRVKTGLTDTSGNEITVSCSTCHSTRKPDFNNRLASDLDEFHLEMTFTHGTTSCLSCHNPNDYDALKLADGSRVEFTDVMTLCGQCHGPQTKDYEHGVHGGMSGYWDLTRGPRTRNNCVDCHNPHVPQFPKMQPTFKPRDRFLDKVSH